MQFGFEWEELSDSPREVVTREGLKATRVFVMAWEHRWEFALAMLGRSIPFFGTAPAAYPGVLTSRVEKVAMEPFPDPQPGTLLDPMTDLVTHRRAKVIVTYAPLDLERDDDDLPEGTFATYRQRMTAEFLPIPGRALVWESDSEPVSEEVRPTVVVPMTEHVVTWHRVPSPPWSALSQLRGRVNQGAFRIPATDQVLAPETLLFTGAETKVQASTDPEEPITYELTYSFQEKSRKTLGATAGGVQSGDSSEEVIGWNHLLRDDGAGAEIWSRPVDVLSEEPLYSVGDFRSLFAFDSLA